MSKVMILKIIFQSENIWTSIESLRISENIWEHLRIHHGQSMKPTMFPVSLTMKMPTKKKLCLPVFLTITMPPKRKLCLPVFLIMMMPTQKETMVACIVAISPSARFTPHNGWGSPALRALRDDDDYGDDDDVGNQWCRKWTFVNVQCKRFSSFLSFLFVHILFE